MAVVLDERAHRLYVSTGRGGTVAVIDIERDARLVREVEVGKRPWGLALSADGRYLYSANGPSNDVTVVDTRSLNVVRKIAVGRSPWGITLEQKPNTAASH